MIEVTGVDRILNRVQKLQRASQEKYIQAILEQLSANGYNEVNVTYAKAFYDFKNPDIDVKIEWDDYNKVAIRVSGEDALFLEFGTGVYNNTPRDYPQIDGDPRFAIGGYGKHHGLRKTWFYPRENNPNGTPKFTLTKNGVTYSKKWNATHGTPAAKGLYYGMKKMREEVIDIIRSVII